jgi:hypothetical protein
MANIDSLKPFVKGDERCNRKGRKPGSKSITAAYKKILKLSPKGFPLPAVMKDLLKKHKLTNNIEALALRKFMLAWSKNPNVALRAIEDITDRTEGKSQSNVSVTGDVNFLNVSALTEEELQNIVNSNGEEKI